MTRIGVVIPSYNHARFVREAIDSVLGQTHAETELVVVDDGSTDGSPDIIRDALAAHPGRRATLIEQENGGAHAAIMRGFDELDTPVCAVLNSDDRYEPDRFERMLPTLERGRRSGMAIAFSGLGLMDDAGTDLPADHPWSRWYATALTAADTEPTIGFALLVHNFSVTSGNFLFTRSLYDRLGGFGEQKFVHDWDFLLRAAALTEPVFVPDQLMRYRVHDANTTESVRPRLRRECEDAVSRYADLLAEACRAGNANALAPCAAHWLSYWDRFGGRSVFFAPGTAVPRQSWFERLSSV